MHSSHYVQTFTNKSQTELSVNWLQELLNDSEEKHFTSQKSFSCFPSFIFSPPVPPCILNLLNLKRSHFYSASADSVLIWWKKGFTINCVKYDSILIRHEMSGFESCKLLVKINQEQLGASGKSVTISIWEKDKMLVTWSQAPDPGLTCSLLPLTRPQHDKYFLRAL